MNNIISFLLAESFCAIITVVLAFFVGAFVEWYLHAKVLHDMGKHTTKPHEEHHALHARQQYKSAHGEHDYGVDAKMVVKITFISTIVGLLIGIITDHSITVPLCTLITISLYFRFLELVHRRVHNPKSGGWFERTGLYDLLDRCHRVHHAREDRNYCIVFPLIDRLMGTLHRPGLKK